MYISPNSNISTDDDTSTAEPVAKDTLSSWLPVVILLCSKLPMLLAILALTDVNAPLTADLSALVAMLVAMLELKLAVAIPTYFSCKSCI